VPQTNNTKDIWSAIDNDCENDCKSYLDE